MQAKYPEAFVQAHHHLDKNLGFLNTVVLLVSSFTMVMAVHCTKTEQRRKTLVYLLITLACAATFLCVKYFEYVLGSEDFNDRVAKSKFGKMPKFAKSDTGYLALQGDHGQVSFRNIKVLPLSGTNAK